MDSVITAGAQLSQDLLPYAIGLGVLAVTIGAYLIGRAHNRAQSAVAPESHPPTVPQAPIAPAEPRPPQAVPALVNPIRRLDELEMLRDLGILTREEFEREKHKMRMM